MKIDQIIKKLEAAGETEAVGAIRELIELVEEAAPYALGEMAYPDEWYDRAKIYMPVDWSTSTV